MRILGGSGSAQQYALEAPTLLQFVRTQRLLDAKVLVRAAESGAALRITHSAARVVEPAARCGLSCSYWKRCGQNQQGQHANHSDIDRIHRLKLCSQIGKLQQGSIGVTAKCFVLWCYHRLRH